MKMKTPISAVNFHLWEPCNFSCKFCFASFQDVRKTILPKGHLPKEESLRVVDRLAEAGFEKITFVGGEPTLCPWLAELIVRAKAKGLVTMIVTNGSGLTDTFLQGVKGSLDWVVISIDALSSQSNLNIGRSINNKTAPDVDYYFKKVELVKQYGMKLKINTVVNQYNFKDKSLGNFIKTIKPFRWKIFKALRVIGQNDISFNEMDVSDEQFQLFIKINEINSLSWAVTENNEQMTASYAMIDPAGRFFDNASGTHRYSRPILVIGVDAAMKEVRIDPAKFKERGGIYEW
jgi:radical S-adenosyl methionine domain-containing protein 2